MDKRNRGRVQQSYEEKPSTENKISDFPVPHSIKMSSSSTSGSVSGNALKGKIIHLKPILGNTPGEGPLDMHKGEDPSNKHTVSAGHGSSDNPKVSAHGLELKDSYLGPHKKTQKMQKATFMELYGRTVEDAAHQMGVSVARFIHEGNIAGFFEWHGVDRITRLTDSDVDVFFTVRYQDREKLVKVPRWATVNQFKKMTDFPFDGSYYWKLDDKWLELMTPQDWDSCIVWNEVYNKDAEFIEVKLMMLNMRSEFLI